MIWFHRFSDDNTAVSPVIGIVLMVAVTVALAGSMHTFVFAMSEDAQIQPPQAGFTFESGGCNAEEVTVTHAGGESIPAGQLYLQLSDSTLSGSWADPSGYSTTGTGDGTVSVGDRATVCVESDDAILRVVWISESGDTSIILAEWDGD